MSKHQFFEILNQEIKRIDQAGISKRQETIIEDFSHESSPKAIIAGKAYRIFNSNDYLGLRHHHQVKAAEAAAADKYGSGPGAVRFISGSLKIHKDLEQALANWHSRDDALIFSSAFAANLAVLFALIKGQSKDSLVQSKVLVISDELNHRSIIDGIRLANLKPDEKAIFKHLDDDNLKQVMEDNLGKFERVLVVTDGVFSMLGEYQNLAKIRQVIDFYDNKYPQGVLLIVDDCHGIAAFGQKGLGTEAITSSQADVLVGTLGKGLGADGGYVVANQIIIDYLRESGATYIYSNNISPGTAGAALASVKIINSPEGEQMLINLKNNISWFKQNMTRIGFKFAADSIHPIQPLLIADTAKTVALKQKLFEQQILTTNINYPVVPKGRDEIRVQISAAHTQEDLEYFVTHAKQVGKMLGIIS